jgi:hypothetical protein
MLVGAKVVRIVGAAPEPSTRGGSRERRLGAVATCAWNMLHVLVVVLAVTLLGTAVLASQGSRAGQAGCILVLGLVAAVVVLARHTGKRVQAISLLPARKADECDAGLLAQPGGGGGRPGG